jgi:hypothetical protein
MHMHAKFIDEQVDTLHAVARARPSHIPHHAMLLSMRESSLSYDRIDVLR